MHAVNSFLFTLTWEFCRTGADQFWLCILCFRLWSELQADVYVPPATCSRSALSLHASALERLVTFTESFQWHFRTVFERSPTRHVHNEMPHMKREPADGINKCRQRTGTTTSIVHRKCWLVILGNSHGLQNVQLCTVAPLIVFVPFGAAIFSCCDHKKSMKADTKLSCIAAVGSDRFSFSSASKQVVTSYCMRYDECISIGI